MKHRLLIISTILFFSIQSFAITTNDTTTSIYENKTHQTTSIITVNAPKKVCMSMVDDLIGQFRGDPEALFKWAFVGLGEQDGENNEKNEVLIKLKQAIYDKTSGIGTLVVDIVVPGLKTFDDVRIDSKITQYAVNPSTDAVNVDILYSNSLLKKTYGTFFVKELSENKTQLKMEISVRFGWFFNIFISKRRYRNLIEWRATGFMNNLKKEAELRTANLSPQ